jgi:hypothetical protein
MDKRTEALGSIVRNTGAPWAAVAAAYDAGAAAERERCAILCEAVREAADHAARDGHRKAGAMAAAASCAKMIRA